MKIRHKICGVFTISALFLALAAGAKAGDNKDTTPPAATAGASHAAQDDNMRVEGEKKFHANCGRCHSAPPKFSPRMAATIVRHMRVRATITDEEMRVILRYLAQ